MIPATQEVEIRRLAVHSGLGQKVLKTPSQLMSRCGGMYTKFQLHKRCRLDSDPRQERKTLSRKQLEQNRTIGVIKC
jgi:hypothetical protein